MISKHIIRSIFSLAVLLFAASCQKDPDGSAPDGNNLTLQVLLPVEGGTKATEDGEKALNENKISTLDVFIYKEGEDACAHYQRIVPVDGMTRYGISKNRSAFAENTGYSVYVVANAGTAAAGAMSLAELKAAVVAQALNPDAVQTDLLMDGKSIATVLNDGTKANKNIDVSLKRGVAKIRVNLQLRRRLPAGGTGDQKNWSTTRPTPGCWKPGTFIRPRWRLPHPIRAPTWCRAIRTRSSFIRMPTTGTPRWPMRLSST